MRSAPVALALCLEDRCLSVSCARPLRSSDGWVECVPPRVECESSSLASLLLVEWLWWASSLPWLGARRLWLALMHILGWFE